MIKHCIWASMIDYPKNTSTVLFTGACNFNCAYCYNKELKKNKDINFDKEIMPKLMARQDFVNHVILSGGEPTCDENFEHMVDTLYNNGFVVGLHTNGSNPEMLKKVMDKISFFGVDIKTSQGRYNESIGVDIDTQKIIQTIEIIINSKKDYEFRTTLFPKHVSKQDVLKIARLLKDKGVAVYHLQQYYPVRKCRNCG